MKTVLKSSLIVLAIMASGVAMASKGGAGIVGTRHDFATRSNFLGAQVTNPGVANQVGLCSFCHTPHSALSTKLLWNQKITTNNFTWDAVDTSGGTNYVAPAITGPSIKCLSCHDGSVAAGDTAVFAGRAGGIGAAGDASGTGTIVTQLSKRGIYGIGGDGKLGGNHPVSMPYPVNNAKSTYNGSTTGDVVTLTEYVANPHDPAHGVKLYTDTNGSISSGATTGLSGIECTSCHDPHNKQTTDDFFLRGKLTGSTKASGYLCLQCHIK